MEGLGALVEGFSPILGLAALGLALGLGIWAVRLQRGVDRMLRMYRSLLHDVKGRNLEQILESHLAELQGASLALSQVHQEQGRLEAQVRRSLQNMSLVRYNAFRDTGSDQSFSIALLDGRGDGVVLSSLHGRHDVRVFAKPVQNGASNYALSEEEEEAIRQAMQGSL